MLKINLHKMKKIIFIISIIHLPFYILHSSSFAQHNDAWQWTTLSIEKKITPKMSVIVDEELRLFNNISRINLFYTNIGTSYKINNYFKVAGVYRWIEKSKPDGIYSSRHRFYIDAFFKYKYNPVTFVYRARLQTQVRDINSNEDGTVPESYWRSKFDFKFDLNRDYTPYIAAEFRYQFANNRLMEANNTFDRGRYYIGCDYEINKRNSFGLYYMIQREFNVNDPETDYTIGLAYSLSL